MRKLASITATALVAFTIGLIMPADRVQAETVVCGQDGEDCDIYCPSQYGFYNGSYYETQYFTGDCQYGAPEQVICHFDGGGMAAFWCNV